MAQGRINVGPLDARARQVAGALAIVGGLTALDGFFQALGFLTWIICAAMMYVGIILAMGGFKDGTAVFGFPLLILSVLDTWLPVVHKGYWGLVAGVFLAVGAVPTGRAPPGPVNGVLGGEKAPRGVSSPGATPPRAPPPPLARAPGFGGSRWPGGAP